MVKHGSSSLSLRSEPPACVVSWGWGAGPTQTGSQRPACRPGVPPMLPSGALAGFLSCAQPAGGGEGGVGTPRPPRPHPPQGWSQPPRRRGSQRSQGFVLWVGPHRPLLPDARGFPTLPAPHAPPLLRGCASGAWPRGRQPTDKPSVAASRPAPGAPADR